MTFLTPLLSILASVGVLAAGFVAVTFFLLGLTSWFVARERARAEANLNLSEHDRRQSQAGSLGSISSFNGTSAPLAT